jgi:hypothetical protein
VLAGNKRRSQRRRGEQLCRPRLNKGRPAGRRQLRASPPRPCPIGHRPRRDPMPWFSRVLRGTFTGVVALAWTTSAPAIDWPGHRRPTCPPYDAPCFGYHFTTWRTWPIECTGPEPSTVASPVPSASITVPIPAKDQPTKTPPSKDQGGTGGGHPIKQSSQPPQTKPQRRLEEAPVDDTPPSVFLPRAR